VRVLTLLSQAFDALRREAGTWLSPGECYARACARFTAIWKPVVGPPRNTLQKRVIARNGGRCTVPGCTRPAVHAHHIVFRSQGGKDDDRNETGLCALHHLRGIHEGRIRVWGLAPDDLNWEIGVSPGLEPIRVVGPRSAWPPPP
jgi:5-methylcytosine-specific restriction endonuclease McrA